MLFYNFKFKVLTCLIVFFVVVSLMFTVGCNAHFENPSGKLTLIDTYNVVMDGDNYNLDLKPFDFVGHKQTCRFTFRNDSNVPAHTIVDVNYDPTYFQVFYDSEFTLNPGEETDFLVKIVLIKTSTEKITTSFHISFRTEYIY